MKKVFVVFYCFIVFSYSQQIYLNEYCYQENQDDYNSIECRNVIVKTYQEAEFDCSEYSRPFPHHMSFFSLSFINSRIPIFPKNLFLNTFRSKTIIDLDLEACGVEILSSNRDYYPNSEIISRYTNNLCTLQLRRNLITEINTNSFAIAGIDEIVDEIDLSFNLIEKIEKYSFRDMKNLCKLNLSGNNLKNLDSNTFTIIFTKTSNQDLHFELDLSNNSIENIEDNCFQNDKLSRIDLSNNRLHTIQNHLFKSAVDLLDLNLENNLIEDIEDESFTKNSQLIKINFHNNRIKVISYKTFKGAFNLTHVDLGDNFIQEIGEKSFLDQNLLTEISFENNQIKLIKNQTFSNTKLLQTLNLKNNSIEKIEENSFSNFEHMSKISLSDNNLKLIESNTFNGLGWIKFLNLSNQLIESVANYSFRNMSALENLDLQNNTIRKIFDYAFAGAKSLITVNLSQNAINEIGKNCFDSDRIQTIDLRNNQIRIIHNRTFVGAIALKWLYLSNNQIEYIENDTFATNGVIYEIHLSNNKLKTFCDTEIGFVSKVLDILDLSVNKIEKIYFHEYHEIRIMNLSSAGSIKRLDFDAFKGLENTETLVLSNNDLEEFEVAMLHPISNLRNLYIDGNKLTTIDYEDLVFHMETIDLNYNNWNCSFLRKMILFLKEKGANIVVMKKHISVMNFKGIGCVLTNESGDNLSISTSDKFTQETNKRNSIRGSLSNDNYVTQNSQIRAVSTSNQSIESGQCILINCGTIIIAIVILILVILIHGISLNFWKWKTYLNQRKRDSRKTLSEENPLYDMKTDNL